jgi:hypothetical protein
MVREAPMLIAPGYEVCQELSRSECFYLYRGRRRRDGSPVLLKAPRYGSTWPMAARLLKHEYELLSGLSLPGFDQSTLAFVSERSPEAVADDLQEAIDEGLILPVAYDDYAAPYRLCFPARPCAAGRLCPDP